MTSGLRRKACGLEETDKAPPKQIEPEAPGSHDAAAIILGSSLSVPWFGRVA